MRPVSIAQLRATATVDLMTAARALGIGRTKAYELAKHDEFPCPVIRVGEMYRIPTPGLLELLGVTAEEPRVPAAVAARPRPTTRMPSASVGPPGLVGGLRRRA
jgi:hypothetical protein